MQRAEYRVALAGHEARLILPGKGFAGLENELDKVASSMDEDDSGAGELFENEALPAEESRAQLLHECDVQLSSGLRHQETIPLHENTLAGFKIEGLNAAGIGAGPHVKMPFVPRPHTRQAELLVITVGEGHTSEPGNL